jgi:hypothetical protein
MEPVAVITILLENAFGVTAGMNAEKQRKTGIDQGRLAGLVFTCMQRARQSHEQETFTDLRHMPSSDRHQGPQPK